MVPLPVEELSGVSIFAVESELFAESEVVAVELEEAAAVSRLVTFDCNVVFSSFKDSTCFSNSFICPS